MINNENDKNNDFTTNCKEFAYYFLKDGVDNYE